MLMKYLQKKTARKGDSSRSRSSIRPLTASISSANSRFSSSTSHSSTESSFFKSPVHSQRAAPQHANVTKKKFTSANLPKKKKEKNNQTTTANKYINNHHETNYWNIHSQSLNAALLFCLFVCLFACLFSVNQQITAEK